MSLKNQVAQKICCNSASKPRQSSWEVSNKTHRFWDSCQVTHSDIEALGFSKLSDQIGGILLKHPVEKNIFTLRR